MSYIVRGLDPAPFAPLYRLSAAALAARGVRRVVADAAPGYPDRIELRDLAVGEAALLMNYTHQPAETPFRASHAIFVREGATEAVVVRGAIPDAIARRPISLRAFDAAGEMLDGELCGGHALAPLVQRWFERETVAYLHAHYAARGCFAARIDRDQ